jgi:predicted deacylase
MVGDEMVILDRRHQVVHQLNETARHVWTRCDGEHTAMAIAGELVQAFDVDAETAARDVASVLRRLAGAGLVEMELRERAPVSIPPTTDGRAR